MSKVLSAAGKVAGVVAFAASIALTAGATAVAGASLATIASAAGATATVANIGASLTAKKPPARGAVNNITIGTDQPSPYLIGRTYYGGSRIQQIGYGPTIDKVPNPYAFVVDLYSTAGPVEGVQSYLADFVPVPMAGGAATGYAGGFLWQATQNGALPEPAALVPHFAGAPGWGTDYKLSGYAAIAWSLLFDKRGKVFASGVPQLGAVWKGVRVYDPRKDSTYPGGSGAHRITDETTWEWSENPGLHALTYAYGRYQLGTKVFGVGIPIDGIDVGQFVHLANVCDANGWTVGGVIFEPGSKWTNLKDILASGGAEPSFIGGKLGLKISAPRIALDTITADDLADGELTIGAMQGWEERLNTLIPKYRSEPHKWEYVQSTPVTVASYVAEDGERKQEERQFNLVQDKDQAAQLAAYELLDRRELGEIEINCKPRLRKYGPGDLLIVDIEEAGLIAQPCIVLKRSVDPGSMTVSFVLRGETPTKHAFALGQTGTAPPTPSLLSQQDRDLLAASFDDQARAAHLLLAQTVAYPVTSDDDSIIIAPFTGTVDDSRVIDFPAGQIDGLTSGTNYLILWNTATSAYEVAQSPGTAQMASSVYIYIATYSTSDAGVYPGQETPPGGYVGGGGYSCPEEHELILLANSAKDGSGETIPAGQLEAGMWVWSQHETTKVWGAYLVTMTRVFTDQLFSADGLPAATASHLFWTDGGWRRMNTLGKPSTVGKAVAITVADAHTYVLVKDGKQHLSHNKTTNAPD